MQREDAAAGKQHKQVALRAAVRTWSQRSASGAGALRRGRFVRRLAVLALPLLCIASAVGDPASGFADPARSCW